MCTSVCNSGVYIKQSVMRGTRGDTRGNTRGNTTTDGQESVIFDEGNNPLHNDMVSIQHIT